MNESGDSAQLAIDEAERENEEKTKKDEGDTSKTPQGQAAEKESEEGEKCEKTQVTEEETVGMDSGVQFSLSNFIEDILQQTSS